MSRQSSGKSASRQRSYERSSSDVKERCSREPREPRASRHVLESVTPCFRESRHVSERAICNWRVVFQQSNLLLPTGGLSNPMVRMGRSPAHVQACWVDQQFCDVSSLLGRINFMDLYTCIIMQGITINGHQHSLSHLSLAFLEIKHRIIIHTLQFIPF